MSSVFAKKSALKRAAVDGGRAFPQTGGGMGEPRDPGPCIQHPKAKSLQGYFAHKTPPPRRTLQ